MLIYNHSYPGELLEKRKKKRVIIKMYVASLFLAWTVVACYKRGKRNFFSSNLMIKNFTFKVNK